MNREAKEMAFYIRRKVPRPKELPIITGFITDWPKLCWGPKCPLGLLPEALVGRPAGLGEFSSGFPFTTHHVVSFWGWWDRQKDPQAAVDAIWGKP